MLFREISHKNQKYHFPPLKEWGSYCLIVCPSLPPATLNSHVLTSRPQLGQPPMHVTAPNLSPLFYSMSMGSAQSNRFNEQLQAVPNIYTY